VPTPTPTSLASVVVPDLFSQNDKKYPQFAAICIWVKPIVRNRVGKFKILQVEN